MLSRLVIAGAATALALGLGAGLSVASAADTEFQVAQYWGPPPPPPPDWRYRRPPPPREYYGPPPRGGRACYTTRGTCGLEWRAPRGAPCRCFFPGFGEKRGNVI
jgi:hypothetical protein